MFRHRLDNSKISKRPPCLDYDHKYHQITASLSRIRSEIALSTNTHLPARQEDRESPKQQNRTHGISHAGQRLRQFPPQSIVLSEEFKNSSHSSQIATDSRDFVKKPEQLNKLPSMNNNNNKGKTERSHRIMHAFNEADHHHHHLFLDGPPNTFRKKQHTRDSPILTRRDHPTLRMYRSSEIFNQNHPNALNTQQTNTVLGSGLQASESKEPECRLCRQQAQFSQVERLQQLTSLLKMKLVHKDKIIWKLLETASKNQEPRVPHKGSSLGVLYKQTRLALDEMIGRNTSYLNEIRQRNDQFRRQVQSLRRFSSPHSYLMPLREYEQSVQVDILKQKLIDAESRLIVSKKELLKTKQTLEAYVQTNRKLHKQNQSIRYTLKILQRQYCQPSVLRVTNSTPGDNIKVQKELDLSVIDKQILEEELAGLRRNLQQAKKELGSKCVQYDRAKACLLESHAKCQQVLDEKQSCIKKLNEQGKLLADVIQKYDALQKSVDRQYKLQPQRESPADKYSNKIDQFVKQNQALKSKNNELSDTNNKLENVIDQEKRKRSSLEQQLFSLNCKLRDQHKKYEQKKAECENLEEGLRKANHELLALRKSNQQQINEARFKSSTADLKENKKQADCSNNKLNAFEEKRRKEIQEDISRSEQDRHFSESESDQGFKQFLINELRSLSREAQQAKLLDQQILMTPSEDAISFPCDSTDSMWQQDTLRRVLRIFKQQFRQLIAFSIQSTRQMSSKHQQIQRLSCGLEEKSRIVNEIQNQRLVLQRQVSETQEILKKQKEQIHQILKMHNQDTASLESKITQQAQRIYMLQQQTSNLDRKQRLHSFPSNNLVVSNVLNLSISCPNNIKVMGVEEQELLTCTELDFCENIVKPNPAVQQPSFKLQHLAHLHNLQQRSQARLQFKAEITQAVARHLDENSHLENTITELFTSLFAYPNHCELLELLDKFVKEVRMYEDFMDRKHFELKSVIGNYLEVARPLADMLEKDDREV